MRLFAIFAVRPRKMESPGKSEQRNFWMRRELAREFLNGWLGLNAESCRTGLDDQ